MKNYPNLTVKEDLLLVEFNLPEHVGGPIEYFEILEKHNGKLGDIVSVEYSPGNIVNWDLVRVTLLYTLWNLHKIIIIEL